LGDDRYQVCDFYKEFLDASYAVPFFDVSAINKELFKTVPKLKKIEVCA
jgi:hypothetical protein